jgi:hypothetical protein
MAPEVDHAVEFIAVNYDCTDAHGSSLNNLPSAGYQRVTVTKLTAKESAT